MKLVSHLSLCLSGVLQTDRKHGSCNLQHALLKFLPAILYFSWCHPFLSGNRNGQWTNFFEWSGTSGTCTWEEWTAASSLHFSCLFWVAKLDSAPTPRYDSHFSLLCFIIRGKFLLRLHNAVAARCGHRFVVRTKYLREKWDRMERVLITTSLQWGPMPLPASPS